MENKIERIDFFKNEKNWIGYFLIEAMGTNEEDTFLKPNYNPNDIEAQLIINGFPCDLTRTLKHMGEVFDEMVEKRALEIIQDRIGEKFFDQFNELERLTENLKEEVGDRIEFMMSQGK